MPQTKAAEKALRSSAKKRTANDRWRRQMKEALYDVRDAIVAKDKKAAETAMNKAESILDRAARRHVIHANKASRKKSRLRRQVTLLAK